MNAGTDLAVTDAEHVCGAAPALPIEQHIVQAALGLEAARNKTVEALALLQFCPRDDALLWPVLNELVAAVNRATTAYHHYNEVRACAGQA